MMLTDFFLMSNLSPFKTGLPFVVWISIRGNAKHDARVKVSKGLKTTPHQLVSVAIRPDVHIIGTHKLPPRKFAQLRSWIKQNEDILLAYWNNELYTEQALAYLRPLIQETKGE